MIGLVVVVVILGVVASIVVSQKNNAPAPAPGVSSISATTQPPSIASGAQEAAIAACQVNFAAVDTALSDYRTLNSSSPAPGIAWVTSTANGGPFLAAWPSTGPYYSLVWTGTTLDVVPAHGAVSRGSSGTTSPATGCFAA